MIDIPMKDHNSLPEKQMTTVDISHTGEQMAFLTSQTNEFSKYSEDSQTSVSDPPQELQNTGRITWDSTLDLATLVL
jgi:hypothetical protein